MRFLYWFIILLVTSFWWSCAPSGEPQTLFKLLTNEEIGVSFSNDLTYDKEFNVYKYRNFYNGGGVSIGDINNDGLPDIYLTANQDSNRLYLNKGGFKFEDITAQSGVHGQRAWSTGVTMVDINADGHLDIYVCNSGDLQGDDKENELFINNGDLTFTESAEQFNLNDRGYSTHASFFDYDRDGDLDVYVLNNSYQAIGSFNLKKNERPNRDELGGDKLMRNEGGIFVDVSESAGIYGSVIGFGLGVTVGDVNNDNWEDIFVSNDFFERDYLYINQKDGTFKEDLTNQMMSISGASMGADLADIDNDGNGEIFVTEMLPFEYDRLKTVTTFESWDKYSYNVQNDYHHQFTRNTLHYNNGNGSFSEISRMLGVEATDWSWGALFFDMDNDGLKDLYVANGIYKDLTNQDYLQYIANEEVIKSIVSDEGVNYKELIDIIPSNKVANRAFRNLGNLQFDNYTEAGLDIPSFSNGSAYGDFDNDGDLDLVVNNVNMPVFIFENKSNQGDNNYIKIQLKGVDQNVYGIGAKIVVSGDKDQYHYEQQPTRGFQSSVDMRPNIGVGKATNVDIQVIWPSGNISNHENIATNQIFTINESESQAIPSAGVDKTKIFTPLEITTEYSREETHFVDFNRERLLYQMRSNEGPHAAVGDLNKDGFDDIVIPGSKNFTPSIFIGSQEGYQAFDGLENIDRHRDPEHVQALLFDVDNDSDLDIYFASGSVEHSQYSPYLFDLLYVNEGSHFKLSEQKFPNDKDNISTGTVANGDYDGDGDQDLFVGERVKIGDFGKKCSGYILENDGSGVFTDVTDDVAPDLKDLGLITDSEWVDIEGDGDLDLLVIGEFMGVVLFVNDQGQLSKTNDPVLHQNGWWQSIHVVDIDSDGDYDIVAGNHGLNSRFKASKKQPIKLFVNDFDKNGTSEAILTMNAEDGKDYPYALRHNLVDQIKELRRKFPDFESFKTASMTEIFEEDQLGSSDIMEIDQLESTIFINQGNLKFESKSLPIEAQFSPVYAIASGDFDGDGDIDLVCGGNQYKVQPEMGIYDASYGIYLENDGKGQFTYRSDSGFFVKGEIRDLIVTDNQLIVLRSQGEMLFFEFNNRDEG